MFPDFIFSLFMSMLESVLMESQPELHELQFLQNNNKSTPKCLFFEGIFHQKNNQILY